MDEKLEASASSETQTAEAGSPRDESVRMADVSPANAGTAAETVATTATVRSIDLNELQEFSDKKLKALARDLSLHLHPARSRHQHILDLVRAAISSGTTVTAEGFVDQVSDSFAMLRWPELNFLPVPEDVAIPRTLI